MWRTTLTKTQRVLATCFSVGVLGFVLAGSALAGQHRALKTGALVVHPDGRVAVMVELAQPTVAQVYAQEMHAAAFSLGVKASAVAAAQAQLARLTRAQDALVTSLTGPQIKASVLYRAQRAYNGVAVEVDPVELAAIRALPGVKAVHALVPKYPSNTTSVPFIQAPQVWDSAGLNATGAGVKVGVIDTGIDYLHLDFGGSGTYRADDTYVDPNWPKNAKVVGGTDFVGDNYDADGIYGPTTPAPDPDPQDCNGHGTHVAGTLAGYGETIDNTTFTGPYGPSTPFATLKIGPGVAPGAELYSLRVFGCQGSTDMVVPAIEWAMDPNGDGDFSDHLDVINMSLGAPYGSTDDPDAVASDQAALAGVSVVAAAGNEGDGYFIAGDPGIATRAISVASAGDPGALTYTVQVNSPASVAGQYQSTPAAFGPELTGTDITSDLVRTSPLDACNVITNTAAITGKIAVIDRGGTNPDGSVCTFVQKVFRAQAAGATFVIIANNRDGNVLVNMADDGFGTTITIPSCFISQNDGNAIKGQIASPGVNATVLKASLADVVSDFSSRGPRGGDLVLKPDVAAPGFSITSAYAGTGTEAIVYSGTSMATPHVAGTVALLKQVHPDWTVEQLKAAVLNTATNPLYLGANMAPPFVGQGRAGAGMVNAAAAAETPAVAFSKDTPGAVSVSFGALEVREFGTWSRTVEVDNPSGTALSYDLGYTEVVGTPGVTVSFPGGASVNVPAGGSATFAVQLSADPSLMKHTHDASFAETSNGSARSWLSEETGHITLTPATGQKLRVPLYAAVRPASLMGTLESRLALSGDGTFQIHLQGQGLSTGTAFPEDEVSLVSAFELQEANADPSADIRDLGVASDYQAQVAAGKGIADSAIYFGVVTSAVWSNPIVPPIDIVIDTNGDNTPDFELAIDEVTQGSDVFAAFLCSTSNGACELLPLGGVTPDVRDTVPYDTDVFVLPVNASTLGLSVGHTSFRYARNAATPAWHTFDVAKPGFFFAGTDYLGQPATQPLYTDLPGQTIQVTYSRANASADGTLGVLLFHHHNVAGSRAEVLGAQIRKPRKLLKR
jgi:subtilisin family serine protease